MTKESKRVWAGSDSLARLLVSLADLHEDPDNANTHPERSVDEIRRSFERFGQQKPVVVAKDGRVVAGNGGLAAARALGWTHLAAAVTALTGDEARAYAIVDNRSAQFAAWDPERLLSQIGPDPAAAIRLGFNDAEVALVKQQVPMTDADIAAIAASWSGMPTFRQGDTRAHQSVLVHLKDAAALAEFCTRLGVTVTDKTKSLWWPEAPAPVVETEKVYTSVKETAE